MSKINYDKLYQKAKQLGIDDAFDKVDIEAESNKRTHELCKWIEKNNRNPIIVSKNKEEANAATFLRTRRATKNNKTDGKFYISDQKIAESYGYDDLFNTIDYESESNKKTKELCEWIKKYNKRPNIESKNKEEKCQAIFFYGRRKARKGNDTGVFHDSDQKIAESYGYDDLFNEEQREEDSNAKTRLLCTWTVKHGKTPSHASKDENEKKLAQFLSLKRMAKKSLGGWIFYSSDQKIAKSYKLNDLFNTIDREKESNEKVHELCKWVIKNNRIPSQKSKNSEEKKLSIFLRHRRNGKLGTKKEIFHKSDQKIAECYGLKELFDTLNPETDSNNKVHELCKFIVKNKRNPSSISKDIKEKKMANFFFSRRKAKKDNSNRMRFFTSDQKIAGSYGLKDLFD